MHSFDEMLDDAADRHYQAMIDRDEQRRDAEGDERGREYEGREEQVRMATEPQLRFIKDLAMDREIPEEFRQQILARVEAKEVSFRLAKEWIPRLKAKPLATEGPGRIRVQYRDTTTDKGTKRIGFVIDGEEGTHPTPAGKYALDTTGDDRFANDVTFFSLWVGERSGWRLFMYVSDETVPLSVDLSVAVLKRIMKDPGAAMRTYGLEKCRCGVCNRKLTNDASRARGIGPICAENWGF